MPPFSSSHIDNSAVIRARAENDLRTARGVEYLGQARDKGALADCGCGGWFSHIFKHYQLLLAADVDATESVFN